MHYFRSYKIRQSIALGIGAAIGVLYFMSVVTANADSLAGVSMSNSGQVIVKGARIVHVGANELIAVSEWGKSSIRWTVVMTGSTKFEPARKQQSIDVLFHEGELVGFTGQLDQRAGNMILYAAFVRNESVMQSSTVLNGSVIGTDEAALFVQTANGTSTIRIGTGTIMTRNGNKAAISDLHPGEPVKAFGTFNTQMNVLDADRVVSSSVQQIVQAPQKYDGFIEHIVAWLSLRGSALSVR